MPGGTVTTHVQDSGGSPVAGRTVTIGGVGQTTDASGNTSHAGLTNGVQVSAVLTGYGTATLAWSSGVAGSGLYTGDGSGTGATATATPANAQTTLVRFVETAAGGGGPGRKGSLPGVWGVA